MATAVAPVIDYELLASPEVPKQRYEIQAIPYRDTVFRLRAPIEISLFPDDGMWICESEAVHSSVHGQTLEEAVNTFCEDFAVLWDEIAMAPDEILAPETQRFKATLQSLVRSVEKVR